VVACQLWLPGPVGSRIGRGEIALQGGVMCLVEISRIWFQACFDRRMFAAVGARP